MPLNKSDKIIIVLFVAVLIVSAVGIALYKPAKKTEVKVEEEKYKSYNVDWRISEDKLQDISEYVGNKEVYEDKITIHKSNIKTLSFNMSWVDNKAFLGILGRDTLTLEVTTPDGMVYTEYAQSSRKTKAGNILISIPVNSNPPSVSSIKANSTSEAYEKLKGFYNDKWMDKEFTFKVSVRVGEKILWRLRDKGNSFTLSISYEYYNPVLTESKNSNNTNDHAPSSYIKDTGVSTIGRMVTSGSCVRY